jgi:hypothetical protein
MWLLNEETPTFRALSYGDKLRVGRCLALGKAPDDPRLAIAAVELGDSYQRRSRAYMAIVRWGQMFLALGVGLSAASRIGKPMWPLFALAVFASIWTFAFDPSTRPRNMARGLEASRRIATALPMRGGADAVPTAVPKRLKRTRNAG